MGIADGEIGYMVKSLQVSDPVNEVVSSRECIINVMTNLEMEPGWVGEIACNLGKLIHRHLRQFIVVDNGTTARRFTLDNVT